MTFSPCNTRMQNTNVKITGKTFRIARGNVISNDTLMKSLTMDRNVELLDTQSFRFFCGKNLDVLRHPQTFGDVAFSIMISRNDQYPDPLIAKFCHFLRKEHACVVVTPVAIIEIPGDHHEFYLLRDRKMNEIFKRSASCIADLFNRCTFVSPKPNKGTVNMNVCCVNKPDHRTCLFLPALLSSLWIAYTRNESFFRHEVVKICC